MIEIEKVLLKVFPGLKLTGNISELKMGDIPEWDSLGNFNLLMEIENHFEIRFDIDELESLDSIKAIYDSIAKAKNDSK